MAKNMSHDEWVAHQFENLKCNYRSALLHASLIEGIVCKNSPYSDAKVFHAIRYLQCLGRITEKEYEALEDVRSARNKLAHRVMRDDSDQRKIEGWVKDLLEKILKAYGTSDFLDREFFTRYKITKPTKIAVR